MGKKSIQHSITLHYSYVNIHSLHIHASSYKIIEEILESIKLDSDLQKACRAESFGVVVDFIWAV